jgi:hypothetical protein
MTPAATQPRTHQEIAAWVRYHEADLYLGISATRPTIFTVEWLSSEGAAAVRGSSLRAALETAMLLDPVGGEPSEHLGAWLVPPRWETPGAPTQ